MHISSSNVLFILSNSADKLSIGVASKKLLLQLPIPLNIKKKLRDKLSVIQEYHLWGQVIDVKSLTLKVNVTT